MTGTSGNDTFIADNTQGTGKYTFGVVDTINAGPGNDTLKIFSDGTASGSSLNASQITGVENLVINNLGNNNLDVSKIVGLTGLTIDSAAFTTSLTGATAATSSTKVLTVAGQAVTLSNLKGTAALSITAADNAFGTNTIVQLASTTDIAETVALNGVTSGSHVQSGTQADIVTLDIAGAKVTTLNLTATGAASTVTLTNSANAALLATLNIAGDKALTLTEGLANLKIINASTATAAVTLNTTAANAALTFTGGTGNDKISFASGTLVKTQVLDGGAGTDTLIIADTGTYSADLYASINGVKNFEILGFNAAVTGFDLSKVTSVSQFSIEAAATGGAAAAGASFIGESNTQSFIVNANLTGGAAAAASNGQAGLSIAPSVDTGNNIVALTLSGVTVTGGAGATSGNVFNYSGGAAIDLTSFEAVSIVSNANAAGTATLNTLTGGAIGGNTGSGAAASVGSGVLLGANATLTLSGAADLVLGSVVSNFGQTLNNNLTIKAGGLTGALTMSVGSATGNDVITAGSGVNKITVNGGADSIDLSLSTAKADTVAITSAAGTTKTLIDTITGFSSALNTGDFIDFAGANTAATSGAATVTGGTATAVTATINAKGIVAFSAVGSAATFSDYIDAAFSAIGGNANKEVAFQFGSDTYVVVNTTANAGYDAGTDFIAKLVGVTGVTELSATASGANVVYAA